MVRPVAVLMGLQLTLFGQNILNNGGFETGMMCYTTGEWSQSGAYYTAGYQFLLSTDAHSGAYSLEINCTGMDCLKAAAVSDVIQTQPGQSYNLSVYTKCPAGRVTGFYTAGTAGGDTSKYLTCNGDWAPNQITFTTGPAQTNFFFYLFNDDTSWVRFDDVVLTYADGTVPQPQVLHPGTRNVGIAGQTVHVDGAPYFALGFFDVEYDDLPLAAAAGANTVNGLGINQSARCFSDSRESYLDRAYDLGLNFVPNSSSTAELGAPSVFPAAVSTFAPHLANILWFLADEPDQEMVPWEYIPPETFVAEYQAAKPNLSIPVMADFQHAAWDVPMATQPYTGSVDVWMAEPYGPDFSYLSNAVNTFNQLSPRPIWLAQDAIDASLIVPRAYWAAISGVTGIIFFNWDMFKADPTELAAATQAFTELHQLNDVIFAADISSQVAAPPGIGVMARSLDGSGYILAANPLPASVQGRFAVTGLAAGTQIPVLFENRSITADAGGFTDSFSGISRHVYVLPGPPAPVTIATAPAGLAVSVDGQSCVTPCAFQWVVGTDHTIAVNQSTQPGTAGIQYLFSAWSDGGPASHTVITPASALTLTARFDTQYFLTTAASPANGGSISPPSGWYNSGAAVTASASVNNGFQFAGFSGGASGNASPLMLTLSGPASVTANFTSATPIPGWYDVFTSRRNITINHAKISGTLTNFPVLVAFSDPELKSLANGGKIATATGADILFTAGDGITRLNYEVESYQPASGSLVAWVQVPRISSSADASIYLYYGKLAAADQQNPAGVWDSGYRIVNHFSNASDSTRYGNSAVPNLGATPTPNGVAGPAYSVDGVSGRLTIPFSASWNGPFSSYSIEFWIKPGVLPDYSGALAVGGWNSAFNIWFYHDGSVNFRMDTGSGYCATSGAVPLDGKFHHLAMAYDSSQSQLSAFIDGIGSPVPASCSGNVALPATDMTIGRFPDSGLVQATFDELRVSAGIPRSQAWIATGVNNQSSPATFYSMGNSEPLGSVPGVATIATSPPGLALLVDNLRCTSPCELPWTANSSHSIGVVTPQAGATGTQYVFSAWSDFGAALHSVTAPAASALYTASFATQYELTTLASPAADGSVTPATGGFFNAGAVVPVAATANSGDTFVNWTGSVANAASSSTTVTMTGPQTLAANFSAGGSGGPVIQSVATANGGSNIAQNTFIVIKGTNLVPANAPAAGVIWSTAASFASGLMPTQLNGVGVTVDNQPAFVYFYCSAATDPSCAQDQLNILTPLDNTLGPVPVVVTNGATASAPFVVNMQGAAPAFLLFGATGYVAATHATGAYVGPASLYPGASTPAQAGEQIQLYGVGFGLPAAALVNGSSKQSGALPVLPQCTVGGQAANVVFAGLVGSPGLYQLNLTIPAGTPSGDNPVSCSYGGAPTPSGDLITVGP